jgi:hypothetical protein
MIVRKDVLPTTASIDLNGKVITMNNYKYRIENYEEDRTAITFDLSDPYH